MRPLGIKGLWDVRVAPPSSGTQGTFLAEDQMGPLSRDIQKEQGLAHPTGDPPRTRHGEKPMAPGGGIQAVFS